MDYLYYSVILLNAANAGYLAAAVVLTVYLIKKSDILLKFFKIMAVIVVAAHTTALLCRWAEAGFDRPPWTNLYESLIFFSWGMGVVSTVTVFRSRAYFLATILYPLAFAGLGLAALATEKHITPLVPSLQSPWLKIHVVMATLAYPGFVTAGAVSLAYLLKSNMKIEKLNAGFAFVGLFFLSVVGRAPVFLEHVYEIPKMALQQNGIMERIPLDPNASPVQWVTTTIPGAGALFLIAILFYLLSIAYSVGALVDAKNNLWDRMRRTFNLLAFLVYAALLGDIYYNIGTRDEITLASNQYEMVILCSIFAVQAIFVLYSYYRRGVDEILPSADWLEEFAYKVTLFAFPFMTLLLITGMLFAYSAWGRYWGWDPKETCALMTWLIFAGYLHSRQYPSKRGTFSSVVSVVGAVSVFFTFLGANLLLSGLHSYGAR